MYVSSTFILRDVPMVDALKEFLESFRLPGESPIVERILEVFSQHWLVSECMAMTLILPLHAYVRTLTQREDVRMFSSGA